MNTHWQTRGLVSRWMLFTLGVAGAIGLVAMVSPARADEREGVSGTDTGPRSYPPGRSFGNYSFPIASLAFTADGKKIIVTHGDDTTKLWETSSVREVLTFKSRRRAVMFAAFSGDGRTVVSAGDDGNVQLSNPDNPMRSWRAHKGQVLTVALSLDGKLVASGGADKTVKLWDLATGKEQGTFLGHLGPVNQVVFSPDGRRLASASVDGTVTLWDVVTRTAVRKFTGHVGAVNCVMFSPDGKLVASGGVDKTVRLWDVKAVEARGTLNGHTNIVTSVAFAPDGLTLVSTAMDKQVRLWETATGAAISSLEGQKDAAMCVAFAPDSAKVAVGGIDGSVTLWTLSPSARSPLAAAPTRDAPQVQGQAAAAPVPAPAPVPMVSASKREMVTKAFERALEGVKASPSGRKKLESIQFHDSIRSTLLADLGIDRIQQRRLAERGMSLRDFAQSKGIERGIEVTLDQVDSLTKQIQNLEEQLKKEALAQLSSEDRKTYEQIVLKPAGNPRDLFVGLWSTRVISGADILVRYEKNGSLKMTISYPEGYDRHLSGSYQFQNDDVVELRIAQDPVRTAKIVVSEDSLQVTPVEGGRTERFQRVK